MKITLPPEVLKSLPEPSSDDGLVRITVGLKLDGQGGADLVEVGDVPMPADDKESPAEDAAAGEEQDAPPEPGGSADENAYMASASDQLMKL